MINVNQIFTILKYFNKKNSYYFGLEKGLKSNSFLNNSLRL